MGIILKWRIFTAVIWLRMDPSDDLVNTAMNLQILSMVGNFLISRVTVSISRTRLHGVRYRFVTELIQI
jgi:hypothetical protein